MTPARLLIVGASSTPTCGVRDHAAALEPALRAGGADTETLWWERNATWTGEATRRSAARFLALLAARLEAADHDAVIWHYAVFDYGPRTAWDLRGLPVHATRFARALGRARGPLIVVLHECAYGWSEPGWQRTVLAAGQRAALVTVLRTASGAVLSTAAREQWLRDRRWLPARPLARIPVCATLRPPHVPSAHTLNGAPARLGVFGFGADDVRPDIVVGATKRLRESGRDVELVLLGAPGGVGERAERWQRAAANVGCEATLAFSGVLTASKLARELAAVDLVVFPHASGCGAGKTTLGSSLAFAKPVVALDGPERWERAISQGALVSVAPDPIELAERIEALLADEPGRARQAAAAQDFYAREMDPAVGAARLMSFLEQLAAGRT